MNYHWDRECHTWHWHRSNSCRNGMILLGLQSAREEEEAVGSLALGLEEAVGHMLALGLEEA